MGGLVVLHYNRLTQVLLYRGNKMTAPEGGKKKKKKKEGKKKKRLCLLTEEVYDSIMSVKRDSSNFNQ